MVKKGTISVVIGTAIVSSALQAEIFRKEREGLSAAQTVIFTIPLIEEELNKHIATLPEQVPTKGSIFGAQPFWKKILPLFAGLAKLEIEDRSAIALKLALGEENVSQDSLKECIAYWTNLLSSLGEKGGALRKFAVVLKSETWPQVYDAKKKGPTPFGSNLHKAYGQSLVSYMGLYHIDERQKTLLCELLNGIFGKKGTIFTGTSVGWIPETVETLYFILLDTFLIYELRYGEFAHTYNARLLGNLIDVVQLFLVHHLTRFYESLVEAVQAQETANANPFGGTEATERVGVPVFDDSHE